MRAWGNRLQKSEDGEEQKRKGIAAKEEGGEGVGALNRSREGFGQELEGWDRNRRGQRQAGAAEAEGSITTIEHSPPGPRMGPRSPQSQFSSIFHSYFLEVEECYVPTPF